MPFLHSHCRQLRLLINGKSLLNDLKLPWQTSLETPLASAQKDFFYLERKASYSVTLSDIFRVSISSCIPLHCLKGAVGEIRVVLG